MEKFVKGNVIVIPFPFSDLSAAKRRPALVLADLEGEDILLCQITSRNNDKKYAVALQTTDFIDGTLPVNSFIRPERIFTASKTIIIKTAGFVAHEIMNKTIDKIISILKQ
jgi:mRNA interferase MazF